MIKRINKIKNFGVFKDFKWDGTIPDFKKHNLFYGWNYSGKTTISRLFRCFELGEKHFDYTNAEFELEDDQSPSKKYNDKDLAALPNVRVFNTDFIIENLKWYSQGDEGIEPIFFLIGEENIERQKRLEKLENGQEKLSGTEAKLSYNKTELETRLETAFTRKARDIKNTLSIISYDKVKFKSSVEALKEDFTSYLLDDANYNTYFSICNNTEQRSDIILNELPMLGFPDIQNQTKEVVERKITVQKIIEELKYDEKLNKWVNEGRDLHKDKTKCLFCGNNLPSDLFQKLDQHFSTEYEKQQKDIKNLLNSIKDHKITINKFVLPAKGEFYNEFVSEYETLQDEFNALIKKYGENIDELLKNLEYKQAKPFDEHKFEVLSDNSSNIKGKYDEIKNVIEKHKNKTANFEKEKNEAKEILIRHFSAQFIQDQNYFKVLEDQKNITEKIKVYESALDKISSFISRVKEQLSESVKGAEKVNEYIQSFFQHDGIKIEVTENNWFKMSRNNEPAKNLSEGEKTAISFAYFIARLEDKNTELEKTIVFIDDPVSSLDNNHLFNTYAFIKSKLANCGQLFISTHNLEFFNLMKDFIKYDCKDANNKGYSNCMPCYLIEKIRNEKNNKNGQSFLKDLPLMLKKFKTEYNYLFSLLKKAKDQKNDEFELFEVLYLLPNITRRFLEGYFGLRYPNGKKLKTQIEDSNFFKKEEDKEKLLKILDEYSHEKSVEHSLKFPDTSEIKEIVSIVLAELKDKDRDHYDALCESCN
jgi:wobble nucleotide-excising tRNase